MMTIEYVSGAELLLVNDTIFVSIVNAGGVVGEARMLINLRTSLMSKYPPAKPGALGFWPLKAADGVADAAPGSGGH
jgi:hypothetical protein